MDDAASASQAISDTHAKKSRSKGRDHRAKLVAKRGPMPYRVIWAGIGLAVSALAVTALVTNLSLWFLWESLPVGEIRLAVNVEQPAVEQVITPAVALIAPAAQAYRKEIKRFAVATQGQAQTISLVPQRLFSKQLVRRLQSDGWEVQRRGLIIIATKGPAPKAPSALHSMRGAFSRFLDRSKVNDPLFIAESQAGAVPGVDQALAMTGFIRRDELTVIRAETLDGVSRSALTSYRLPGEVENLSIALPSKIFSSLPGHMTQVWAQEVRRGLAIVNTEPDILSTIRQHEAVQITLEKDSTTLAVHGIPESFIATIKEAIQAEEAYRRPQRHAFRLPDGTIGFEMIPGEMREVFSQGDDTTRCQEDVNLWLCRSDTAVALSTDRGRARAALEATGWHIRIGEKYLQNATIPLRAVTATGSETTAVIRAKLAQPHPGEK